MTIFSARKTPTPAFLLSVDSQDKTGQIYYVATKTENGATNRWVCSIDPNTKAVREIMKLPRGQEVSAVNADETLLGGTITGDRGIEVTDRVTAGTPDETSAFLEALK